MTTVLVPIDGSAVAIRALRHAMHLAQDIHLINVQARADTPTLLLHMTQDQIDDAQRERGRALMADARRLLDEAGRPYREHIVIGEPAEEITRIGHAEHVDAIVMGTRGMGTLGNLVLGSTATKVVHLADVPVTLVK